MFNKWRILDEKTENVLIRVTPDEKMSFKIKAKHQGITLTSLIINSVNNNKMNLPITKDIPTQIKNIQENLNFLARNVENYGLTVGTEIKNINQQLDYIKRKYLNEINVDIK